MRAGSDELGDCMGQSAIRRDVEDRVGVLAVVQAPFGKNYVDKVCAAGLEEGKGGCTR